MAYHRNLIKCRSRAKRDKLCDPRITLQCTIIRKSLPPPKRSVYCSIYLSGKTQFHLGIFPGKIPSSRVLNVSLVSHGAWLCFPRRNCRRVVRGPVLWETSLRGRSRSDKGPRDEPRVSQETPIQRDLHFHPEEKTGERFTCPHLAALENSALGFPTLRIATSRVLTEELGLEFLHELFKFCGRRWPEESAVHCFLNLLCSTFNRRRAVRQRSWTPGTQQN